MENKELYSEYMKAFLAENSKVNLISKNDEKFLWEKHVCDSLAISEFFDKYKNCQANLKFTWQIVNISDFLINYSFSYNVLQILFLVFIDER